jgi:mRNA interferase RelE/StbE
MKYSSTFSKKALKDLKSLDRKDQQRVLDRIEAMQDNLSGDVKKLTNHTPQYRMRCGNWRVLFEIEGETIIIYRIKHRREAYQ